MPPIINNYDPAIGSGGTVTGGSFNNAPYPFSLTAFVPIPPNEKFLLIPAKQESREINLSFSKPVDLYYGTDDTPFKYLSTIEAYKDTQLGVDLWVNCSESDCQCLIVIRSEKIIDYIGTVTPSPTPTPTPSPQPWAIIAPDQMSVFIDSSKFPSGDSVNASAVIPDSSNIGSWFNSVVAEKISNGSSSYDYYGLYGSFPVTLSDFPFNINSSVSTVKFFLLESEAPRFYIKVLNFDSATNLFTLGV